MSGSVARRAGGDKFNICTGPFFRRAYDRGMSGYGQFCPIAKAAQILAERWTPLVLRELICGSTRSTAASPAPCVPVSSRAKRRSCGMYGVMLSASDMIRLSERQPVQPKAIQCS